PHLVVRLDQHAAKLAVDLFDIPEERLQALDPLEVRDGHAARVRQDVRDDLDAPLGQDIVGLRRGRAVGAFHNHAGLDVVRVVFGDLVFKRARGQHVALQRQQFGVGDLVRLGVAFEQVVTALGGVRQHVVDIQPVLVVVAAGDVADADDPVAEVVGVLGRPGPDVAEALDHDAHLGRVVLATTPQRFVHADDDAAPGRFATPLAAADVERFAGDDRRYRVADRHAVGVHDPGHRLRVGAHIGRRKVAVRADDDADLGGIAPGEPLQLVLAHGIRIADHAALRPAVRQVDERALPRHP